MILEDMVEIIEADFPGYEWLVRSNRYPLNSVLARSLPKVTQEEYKKPFFAHIHKGPHAPANSPGVAYGDTVVNALHKAYHRLFCADRDVEPLI